LSAIEKEEDRRKKKPSLSKVCPTLENWGGSPTVPEMTRKKKITAAMSQDFPASISWSGVSSSFFSRFRVTAPLPPLSPPLPAPIEPPRERSRYDD
jgi:hypothetical protein